MRASLTCSRRSLGGHLMLATPREALRSVTRRWRRNLLTTTAVSIGAATVVGLVVISQGSALEVISRLQRFETSQITVVLPHSAWDVTEANLARNLASQPDVLSFGTLVLPEAGGGGAVVSVPARDMSLRAGVSVASPEGLAARGATIDAGAAVLAPSVQEADPYSVLLGSRIAAELGFSLEGGQTRVEVNGIPLLVTGVVRDGESGSALSASIVLSPFAARSLGLLPTNRVLIINVVPGSAEQVSSLLPGGLLPASPDEVSVQYPPSPQSLRAELLANANRLVVAIGVIMVGVTVFTIVTTMQVAVMERRREIGISRALGKAKSRVAVDYLLEAMMLGALGSSLGLLAGALVARCVTLALGWAFVVPPILLLVPLLGLIVGALAGFWPALMAARTDPAELLRSA
jgi:putative ABC transport system permease protein